MPAKNLVLTERTFLLLALALLCGHTASAQKGIAYAFIYDVRGFVSPVYSLNPSGQPISAAHPGTGTYTVSFSGSGIGPGWNVQVSAFGYNSNHCKPGSWSSDTVLIYCFTTAGALVNSQFTVLAISNKNDKSFSFAWSDRGSPTLDADPLYAFNASGGSITITRNPISRAGLYIVTFNGLPGPGLVLVTSSSPSNTSCEFAYVTTIDGGFDVYCEGPPGSGNPDSPFAIAVIPGDALPGGVAYAYADQLAGSAGLYTPTNAYNPGGSVLISHVDVGIDDVTFRGINPAGIAGGMVQVASRYGSRCNVISWDSGNGSADIVAHVGCFSWDGAPADGGYEIVVIAPLAGLSFFPITPCRVMDTRNAEGPLGGPSLTGGEMRVIPVLSGSCGVPATASALSLNTTVVPKAGTLGYLTLWPDGLPQPNASTLNSPDGVILANAAIIPVGNSGSIDAYALQDTDLILDVDGYFAPPSDTSLAFYPSTPCRLIDTRVPGGLFGSPFLAGGTSRSFPMLLGGCPIPPAAQAYSLNITAVPHGPLGYLSAWPTGASPPNVSTLNSPDGTVRANAALVLAGTPNGSVSFFALNDTDLVVDINGYFAPPDQGGLYFYPEVPCRAVDTRFPPGSLGGPILGGNTSRTFPLHSSTCSLAAAAGAYSLNITVQPVGFLGYLTVWPTGVTQPVVSTLNDSKGIVTANAALVPAGTGASIDVYALQATHVIIDVNGYFMH